MQEKKGKRRSVKRTPPNDAMSVVDHQRSDHTEDDARIVRNKTLDFHPMNVTNLNEIVKKSNHADNALLVSREKKGKMPQRQRPLFSHATNMLGSELFNDSKDDAQTIWDVSVDPPFLDDATEPISDRGSNHIEDDAQFGVVITTLDVECTANSSICPPASIIGGEKSSEDDSLTDKRLFGLINLATQFHTLTRIKKALYKLRVSTLCLLINEKGRNSMGTMDVNSNLQFSLSSGVRRDLRGGCKVLILESSGAGKSTLWKSMTICHEGTLCGPNERKGYIDIIHSNLMKDLRKILRALMKFKVPLDSKKMEEHVITIFTLYELSEGTALAVKALWSDSGVQQIFRTSNSCQLNDSSG